MREKRRFVRTNLRPLTSIVKHQGMYELLLEQKKILPQLMLKIFLLAVYA